MPFILHLFSIYSPFICGTALIAGYSEKVPRHMQWKWREALEVNTWYDIEIRQLKTRKKVD